MYVAGKAGVVRHKVEGELGDDGYNKLTKQIDDLLAEPAPKGKCSVPPRRGESHVG